MKVLPRASLTLKGCLKVLPDLKGYAKVCQTLKGFQFLKVCPTLKGFLI
jgi:hypothetical protein